MRNQHGDFIWYELVTTDLNGAQAFYEAVLGWAIRDSGVPDMDYRLAATATQDIAGLMALPAEALEAGARPVWLGYVAVDDVDAAVAKIVAEGGKTPRVCMTCPDGDARANSVRQLAEPWFTEGSVDALELAIALWIVRRAHGKTSLQRDAGVLTVECSWAG